MARVTPYQQSIARLEKLERAVAERTFLDLPRPATHTHAAAEKLLAARKEPTRDREAGWSDGPPIVIDPWTHTPFKPDPVFVEARKTLRPGLLTAATSELMLAVEQREAPAFVEHPSHELLSVYPNFLAVAGEIFAASPISPTLKHNATESMLAAAAQFLGALRDAPGPSWVRDSAGEPATGLRLLGADLSVNTAIRSLSLPERITDPDAFDLSGEAKQHIAALEARTQILQLALNMHRFLDTQSPLTPLSELYPGITPHAVSAARESILKQCAPPFQRFSAWTHPSISNTNTILLDCFNEGPKHTHDMLARIPAVHITTTTGVMQSIEHALFRLIETHLSIDGDYRSTLFSLTEVAHDELMTVAAPWHIHPHVAGYFHRIGV